MSIPGVVPKRLHQAPFHNYGLSEAYDEMFDAEGQPQPRLKGHETVSRLTSVLTSVQSTTRPDPRKLWDIRPLLKRALVEAPGIEPYRVAFLKSAMPLVFRR